MALQRKQLILLSGLGLLLIGGGILAVVKSGSKACCPTDAAKAAAAPAMASMPAEGAMELPPGHPDISGMAPVKAPALTPEQIAAAKNSCPHLEKPSTKAAPNS